MTTETSRIFAIIPAAGRSRRMGTAKQLLDVGSTTMLDALLTPLAAARVAGIALVTHSGLVDKLALDRFPNLLIAINDDETSDMIDSVRLGLDAWHARETVGDRDGFLICPADHPGISTADFDACIAAFESTPDKIIVAARAARRGHPIIFPAHLASVVQSSTCDPGLNALPRTHSDKVVSVDCPSPGITRDIDTPADYRDLK